MSDHDKIILQTETLKIAGQHFGKSREWVRQVCVHNDIQRRPINRDLLRRGWHTYLDALTDGRSPASDYRAATYTAEFYGLPWPPPTPMLLGEIALLAWVEGGRWVDIEERLGWSPLSSGSVGLRCALGARKHAKSRGLPTPKETNRAHPALEDWRLQMEQREALRLELIERLESADPATDVWPDMVEGGEE